MALKSRIESVKIYHQGATVYRTLEVDAAALADGELEVGQLPLSLADATVRVRVKKTAPEGKALVVRRISVGLAPREAVEPVEGPSPEEIRAAEREVTARRLERAQIAAELEAVESLEVPERPEGEEGRPPPASPMAARVALESFRGAAVDQRTIELRKLDEVLEELEEKLAELQQRAREASSANRVQPGELAKVIFADVEAEGVEKAELELEYFVPGARWAPAYQCHLSRDGSETTLKMRALICQRSGEDWRGVKLKLSTASPMRWSELPELSSVRIGRAQPTPPPVGFRPPPRGAAQLFADYDLKLATSRSLVPGAAAWRGAQLPSLRPPAVATLEHEATVSRAAPKPAPRRMKKMAARDKGGARTLDDFDEATPAEGSMITSMAASVDLAYDEEADMMFDEVAALEAPEPMAAMAPPPPAAPAMRSRASLGAAPGGAKHKEMQAAPTDDELGTIYFHQLVLGGPEDPSRRSRLMPASLRDRYAASLARAGVHLDADPISVVQQAQELARAAASAQLPAGAVDVRQVAGHFDFLFEGKTAIDVPSDGVFHSVPLSVEQAEAELRYVVVPREDTHVFRVATVRNPTPTPLLSGPAEVYVSGEYVLTTNIPTVGPQGEFRLGLGVEQAIKCARNTRYAEKRSGEKVVAMNELEHSIEIELANRLGREVECEVRERIPHPAEGAEVVIEELEVAPAWTSYDQIDRGRPVEGGRKWTVKVGAGETARLKAEYVVRIYANNELVGGNRREA